MHARVSLPPPTGFFKMYSLNPREQMFLVALLVATLLGCAVRYWRDARRELAAPPLPPAAAVGIQTAVGNGKL